MRRIVFVFVFVFVFDLPLLDRLRLSSKRLVFLVDRLAELGTQHDLEVHPWPRLDRARSGSVASFSDWSE